MHYKNYFQAYRVFNGRFYNGKQLSLQFIKMDSWRSAICGSFLRRACVKGRTCNYLHVFRNPTKEFVAADHDWKEKETKRTFTVQATPKLLPVISDPSPCIPNEPTQSHVLLKNKHEVRNGNRKDDYTKRKRDLIHDKSHYSNKSRSESTNSKSKHAQTSSRSEHSRSAKRKKSHKKEKKKSKKVKKNKKHHKKKAKE